MNKNHDPVFDPSKQLRDIKEIEADSYKLSREELLDFAEVATNLRQQYT